MAGPRSTRTMSVATVRGRRSRLTASTVPQKPPPTMTRVLCIVENSTKQVNDSFANILRDSWSNTRRIPAKGRPMRPSKSIYYADFVVYPAVIVGLAAFGLNRSNWQNLIEWLCIAMAGFVIWTLLEYVLHRSVLHKKTYFAPMHGQHHASPLSFIGTPPWISVFVLCGTLLVPIWWCVGFNVADGVTVGVMIGYWSYGVVHHMIHHHAHDSSSVY